MNKAFEFLGISTKGRLPRLLVGLALIICGTFVLHGVGGWVVANVGAFPFTYGLFEWE